MIRINDRKEIIIIIYVSCVGEESEIENAMTIARVGCHYAVIFVSKAWTVNTLIII